MVDTRDLTSRVNCLKKSTEGNIGTVIGSNPIPLAIPSPELEVWVRIPPGLQKLKILYFNPYFYILTYIYYNK